MMKKWFALLLALLLLCSLAACGSEGTGAAAPSGKGESASTVQPDASEPEEPAAPEEPEAPEEPAKPEGPESEVGECLGSVSDGVYQNRFFGMGCELDETWSIADEAALAQLGNTVSEVVASNEELAKQLGENGTVYDFYASADDGLKSLNIVLENLGLLYGLALDESDYVEASLEQVDQALEAMGMEDGVAEAIEVQFAGGQHAGIRISGTLYGLPFYEQLVSVKQGNYMAVITAASFQEDITGELLELFHAVE